MLRDKILPDENRFQGSPIFGGKWMKKSCEIPCYNAQTKMAAMAIAIGLTYQRFGLMVPALNKAMGKAQRHKRETSEDFLSPLFEGREGFAHRLRPMLLDLRDPNIQFRCCCSNGSGGIPGTERFLELPSPTRRSCQGTPPPMKPSFSEEPPMSWRLATAHEKG
jgi:hypothetical protein